MNKIITHGNEPTKSRLLRQWEITADRSTLSIIKQTKALERYVASQQIELGTLQLVDTTRRLCKSIVNRKLMGMMAADVHRKGLYTSCAWVGDCDN